MIFKAGDFSLLSGEVNETINLLVMRLKQLSMFCYFFELKSFCLQIWTQYFDCFMIYWYVHCFSLKPMFLFLFIWKEMSFSLRSLFFFFFIFWSSKEIPHSSFLELGLEFYRHQSTCQLANSNLNYCHPLSIQIFHSSFLFNVCAFISKTIFTSTSLWSFITINVLFTMTYNVVGILQIIIFHPITKHFSLLSIRLFLPILLSSLWWYFKHFLV